MAFYGFYQLLESAWIALGRPHIDLVATGVGMLGTVALGFMLVPRAGLTGAAIGFAAGSALKLGAIGGFSILRLWSRRVRDEMPSLEEEAVS